MEDELARLTRLAREWAEAGSRLALATVVRTWGSAPRRAGSHLLIRDDTLFEGSVSGGCVEGEVVVEAQEVIEGGKAKLLEFGVADETAWRAGLGCGGQVAILVQRIEPGQFDPALFRELEAARVAGRGFAISFDLAGGPAHAGDDPGPARFVAHYDPPKRLAIVGAVHIAQMLAPIARLLGHEVVVIDPRGAFAAGARFGGEALDVRWPDEALADFRPDPASAIVALTHDPKIDDPALAAALASPAYYIAALGSRANQRRRLERLRAAGVAESELGRVRGPAGLPIGAEGPAEIALSIAAEMVAAWRGAQTPGWPPKGS
ncbi:MAG: XdhC family protein [Sphingomonadaceae bacterium]|nr:XdhC family protein [Sphingomonadaceae bacterium]